VLAERPLAQVAVRCAVLAGLVVFVALPVYVWVEPSWRGLVARLAGGIVLGVTLLELRGVLAEAVAVAGASALDAARMARGPEPGVPHHFGELASDLRTAMRSRRYFETVLWPRLEALAGRPLTRPPLRRGRGPGLAGLGAVIADIEERP